MRLIIPGDVLTREGEGGIQEQLTAGFCGRVSIDAAGLAVDVGSLEIGGTFRLGGEGGFLVENALLRASNLQSLLGGTGLPFQLGLAGKLTFPGGGPGFELEDAVFTFAPGGVLFSGGVIVSPGEDLLELASVLPLRITEAGLIFIEERPIAAGKAVDRLTEEDVSAFLVAEIPKLVVKP